MTPATRRASLASLISAPGVTLAAPPILIPPAAYFDLAGEELGARMILTQGTNGDEFCLRPDFTLPIAIEHIAAGAVDGDAPAHAQFAHRPDDLDQQALHRLDPAEHLNRVDRIDVGDQ